MSPDHRTAQVHPIGDEGGLPIGWLRKRRWNSGDRTIRAVQADDLEYLRRWRNEQQAVLRQQQALTSERQTQWFERVVSPSYEERHPDTLLVVVREGTARTSYGGLTNIDWISSRAELSFLAATERAGDPREYDKELSQFLMWSCQVAFDEVGLHRLFAETWAFRTAHISVLEKAGFVNEGTMRDHVMKDGHYHDAILHGLLASDWRTHG